MMAQQVFTRFVKLETLSYRGFDLGDLVGEADDYVNARIGGQPYTSAIINGEDAFGFPGVYAPFTWIRAVPTTHRAGTPITSMTVRVETGDRRFAGTDDDVHLRVGDRRFSLEKRAYDDFERGDDDTYSVPIGNATRDGFTIGDITRVAIEKSRDGAAGGWFLKGVTLVVNGRTIVNNRSINRWLEDDRRTWTAPGLARDHRTDDVVGVWLQLRDDDFGPQDTGDINEYDRHTSQPVAYRLGPTVTRTVTGGDRLKGRLSQDNGDKARLTYRLSTFGFIAPPPPVPPAQPDPTPQPPPNPQPPPPGPKPDLVITGLTNNDVTVSNQGLGTALAFNVTVTGYVPVRFPLGLAPGASQTLIYNMGGCDAGDHNALADSAGEIAETDETNNTRSYNQIC